MCGIRKNSVAQSDYLGGVDLVVLTEGLAWLHRHEFLYGEVHAQRVQADEEQLQERLANSLHHELFYNGGSNRGMSRNVKGEGS